MLRRKLRRARRASTRRKRAAEARQAQKQAEKRAATQRARAEADAKSARKRTRAPLRADDSGPESNRFGVAHSRDGPRDSNWLAGEYEENVPVHVEREIAAAALDEVAMALAAEGDTDAARRSPTRRSALPPRSPQEDPARGAREPLEHAVLKPGKQPFGGDRARSRGIDGGRDRSFRSRRTRRVSRADAASRAGTRFRSGATRRRRRPSRGAERSPASPSRTGARRGALGTGAPRPSRSRRPRSRWRRAPPR